MNIELINLEATLDVFLGKLDFKEHSGIVKALHYAKGQIKKAAGRENVVSSTHNTNICINIYNMSLQYI